MAKDRHSYIAFYPSDWIAGTARMTPMQELVYFRVCVFNWDKGVPVPAGELPLMLGTVPDWRVVLLDLVHAGKLVESPDGSVANTRAVSAAREANDLWAKKSKGGKTGAAKTNASKTPDATPDATPAESADETHAATPVETPAASDDGTGPGLPPHNHNHNHNQQVVVDALPSAAPATKENPNEGKQEVREAELLEIPEHLRTRKAKRSRLETWDIAEGDKHVTFARECGMDTAAIGIECAKFENHHKAAGTLMVDWDAAWRTWCLRWQSYERRAG